MSLSFSAKKFTFFNLAGTEDIRVGYVYPADAEVGHQVSRKGTGRWKTVVISEVQPVPSIRNDYIPLKGKGRWKTVMISEGQLVPVIVDDPGTGYGWLGLICGARPVPLHDTRDLLRVWIVVSVPPLRGACALT